MHWADSPGLVMPLKVCENYHPTPGAVNSAADDTAADHKVVTVPHDGLPRRDRALGRIEDDLGGSVSPGAHRRRRGAMAMTDARLDPQRRARRLARDEVHVGGDQPITLEAGR